MAVLVAHEDEELRAALEARLAQAGLRPVPVATTEEAIHRTWHESLGGVVLSGSLPPHGGLEVVRRLRLVERTAHMPVALLGGGERPCAPPDGAVRLVDGDIAAAIAFVFGLARAGDSCAGATKQRDDGAAA